MTLQGYEWGEEYLDAGRRGIREFLEGQMQNYLDRYLVEITSKGSTIAKMDSSAAISSASWGISSELQSKSV